MRIALAQTNPLIGDVDGNLERILRAIDAARRGGADLVLLPEQAILGYPAKDLLLRREVIERNVAALQRLRDAARDLAVVVGFAEPNEQPHGRPVFNSAAVLAGGEIVAIRRKRLLPTYDVFDEARYFEPAGPQPLVELRGRRIGVTICEDLLSEPMFGRSLYACDPVAELAAAGAEIILNLSASPYCIDKASWRERHIGEHAARSRAPIVYVNQVGGNDELLFDGASFACDATGRCIARAAAFEETVSVVDLDAPREPPPLPERIEGLHAALVMGLRDYVRKCGFESVVLGLSGGIDSAVTAALAAEALGAAHVHGVAMPSRYSSAHSLVDARTLAENLGIRFSVIEIGAIHDAFERTLTPHFAGRAPDVAEENLQARARGAVLMGLSNKFGSLLLTTGNKSELAVGYCTLYGDMCGGLAVISDVPKTLVYELARHINVSAGRDLIPQNTIDKPPSAELRPDQFDQQTLPPYDVLDAILERYEERMESRDEIVAAGFDAAVVDEVLRMMQRSEYKRQQAAPGLKVTTRAFGSGRRMPIAARHPR
ncbi:MAG: NAD+ synthase [Planctomycetota bacterium]|nr:MAG: NAD+ synthase [Planctomycetota bacterium]